MDRVALLLAEGGWLDDWVGVHDGVGVYDARTEPETTPITLIASPHAAFR